MNNMWQNYYNVETMTYTFFAGLAKDPVVTWIITHKEGESEGNKAYHVEYRTKKLAQKGAERLYRRLHGNLENALELNVV